jgi:hypothetical protein
VIHDVGRELSLENPEEQAVNARRHHVPPADSQHGHRRVQAEPVGLAQAGGPAENPHRHLGQPQGTSQGQPVHAVHDLPVRQDEQGLPNA